MADVYLEVYSHFRIIVYNKGIDTVYDTMLKMLAINRKEHNNMKLEGKRAVITGASSGIGLELLKILLKKDCTVVASARQIEKSDLSDPKLYLRNCNVSKKEDLDDLFAYSLEKMGSIDLFIANAGFAYFEKIDKPDWEHIEAIFETNVVGFIYCAEKIKELNGSKPYNFIVTASGMSLLSLPGYSLYSGTKAAIRGFADAYRFELEKGQHFQVVYPIATKTNFFSRAGNNTPVAWPTQTAETVAQSIVVGIQKNRKRIFPSKVFYATNLLNRILPFINMLYVYIYDRKFQNWLQIGQQKGEH